MKAPFLALLLPLAGCLSPTIQLDVAKGVLVAEAATDGVNRAAIIAAPMLHGGAALRVKACVDGANNATSAARALQASGDIPGASASVSKALDQVAACTAATNAVRNP